MAVKRLLLLSGGTDSLALAWHLRPALCLTIDYGQRAAQGEIQASKSICEEIGLRHRVISLDCGKLGSGNMAGTTALDIAPAPEWWPFRNQLLITIGAMLALQERLTALVIGTVATDNLHADGRAGFLHSMNEILKSQEGELALEYPAIAETTAELCRRVDVPYSFLAWAHSCHVAPSGCGSCRGCIKHRETMRDLGYGEY